MDHYVFSYFLTGTILAAFVDIFLRDKMEETAKTAKEELPSRFWLSFSIIVAWLPILIYTFVDGVFNGKKKK